MHGKLSIHVVFFKLCNSKGRFKLTGAKDRSRSLSIRKFLLSNATEKKKNSGDGDLSSMLRSAAEKNHFHAFPHIGIWFEDKCFLLMNFLLDFVN
jgi:hypothetical protein